MRMTAGSCWPVNLTAFDSRLNTARCRKVGSAHDRRQRRRCRQSMLRPRVSSASLSRQAATRSFMSTVVGRSEARPICENDSRSSTSLPARRAASLMFFRKRWRCVGVLAAGRFDQQVGEADDVAQRRAQVVRHRIREGFQFLVGAAQFLGQLGHLLGALERDAEQGGAEFQRQLDLAAVPGQRWCRGWSRARRRSWCAATAAAARPARGRLHQLVVRVAGPFDRVHELGTEPQQVMLVDARDRHRQQAAGVARSGRRRAGTAADRWSVWNMSPWLCTASQSTRRLDLRPARACRRSISTRSSTTTADARRRARSAAARGRRCDRFSMKSLPWVRPASIDTMMRRSSRRNCSSAASSRDSMHSARIWPSCSQAVRFSNGDRRRCLRCGRRSGPTACP